MIANAPIRTEPFAHSCYASGNERELLNQCLDSCSWSAFKGALEGWGAEECLSMASADAAAIAPLDIRFLGGRFVRELEGAFSKVYDCKYSVSSNSATSCLVMAMGAVDLEPGDEVICPCMSFNATATAILAYNAIPVFCEVKPDTFCIDPVDFEKKITERTRAVLVVHLGGNAADMDAIMAVAARHGLKVIEDCAQALGVRYKGKLVGTFGDCGVFSFTETKSITCGEGGMLTTNSPYIARKARLIRNHGEGVVGYDWSDKDLANIIGMNFRLTEFQAAVMIPQFEDLEHRNAGRKENTAYLKKRLAKHKGLIHPVAEVDTDYVCFMLKWKWQPKPGQPNRDELVKALRAEGIPVAGGYGRMMHENPMFVRRIAYGTRGYPWSAYYREGEGPRYGKGTLPISEAVNDQFIWFKFINPPNTTRDMDDVVRAFDKVLGG